MSDATGWFEPLYRAAADGDAVVPWDDHAASPLLVSWSRALDGAGRRAIVVGCGLGDDAEHVASLGFRTVAFDIAPTAIAGARRRFADSAVEYVVADCSTSRRSGAARSTSSSSTSRCRRCRTRRARRRSPPSPRWWRRAGRCS